MSIRRAQAASVPGRRQRYPRVFICSFMYLFVCLFIYLFIYYGSHGHDIL